MATDYGDAFFGAIRKGCIDSARVVVPLVMDHIAPRTVLDVGCGEGHWGAAFVDHGCEAEGIDGDYVESPVIPFTAVDLTKVGQTVGVVGSYDLVVCLEVAEHLPAACANNFIKFLCSLAPVVLFSAAIPGQGGTGHYNERWPAYWVDRFRLHGFACSGALRFAIWDDDRVENWYRQNLLVATRTPEACPRLFDTPLAPPWPLVHPVLYDARRT